MTWLARRFRTPAAKALLAGVAAHSFVRLEKPITGAFALSLLASAHAVGWPIPRGGSQRIADALASYLRSLGGEIVTDHEVRGLDGLPPHRALLLDLTPRQVLAVAGDRLGGLYAAQLRRFRYGPGVFKVDLALDGPIPWANPALREAGTVHLGGTLSEVTAAERAVAAGRPREPALRAGRAALALRRHPRAGGAAHGLGLLPRPERVARRHDRADPGPAGALRAGRRAAASWAARRWGRQRWRPTTPTTSAATSTAACRTWPSCGRGRRCASTRTRTPDPGILICSSSTPPGGGVHGLCGYHAAQSALHGVLR